MSYLRVADLRRSPKNSEVAAEAPVRATILSKITFIRQDSR